MRRIFIIATCALSSSGVWAQVVFNSVSVRTRDGQIQSYAIEQVDSITFDTIRSVQTNKWYHTLENPGIADYLRDFEYDPSDYTYHRLFDYRGEPYLDTRQDWPYGVTLGDTTYYNLIPDKTYTLLSSKDGVLAPVTIRTLGQIRMIRAEGVDNVRDLGGWPTASGKRIRYGMLYRGVEMNTMLMPLPQTARSAHCLTDNDKRIFIEELGIRAELDLRSLKEIPSNGISALGIDIVYANFNIVNGEISSTQNRAMLLSCFRFISEQVEAGNPIYIHCVWGADRTGMLCMLLEGLLGVGQSNLDKDYELSSFAGNTRYRYDSNYLNVIKKIVDLEGSTLQEKFRNCWRMIGATDAELDRFIEMMTD
ncbi:MAG: tyrosine-protein phosphatase [Bacteroidales bacterium]|nr:tyrosine-protein phosphatase [Bacteroidales bacterium]